MHRQTATAGPQKLAELQATIEAETAAVAADDAATLQPVVLRPKKSDVSITTVALAWVP